MNTAASNPIHFISIKHVNEAKPVCWMYRPILFFVKRGLLELTTSGIPIILKTDDLLLIDAFSLFQISNQKGEIYQFSLDFKEFSHHTGILCNKKILCNSICSPDSQSYRTLRQKLCALLSANIEDAPMYYCAQTEVMACLLSLFSTDELSLLSDNTHLLLQKSFHFIQEHYTEPILVKDIARACHITETYLAHLYKENLSLSPSQFLRETRLLAAEQLLPQPQYTLTAIAERSGFSSLRSFNFYFSQKYGCYPGMYRNRLLSQKQEHTSSIPDTALHEPRKKIMDIKLPEISLSTTKQELSPFTYGLLHFGMIGQLNHHSHRSRLSATQNTFHFHYIMLDGIFDSDVLKGIKTEHGYLWDYSLLDDLFHYLLSEGFIPLLSLSSIPDLLSSGNSRFFYSNTDFPDSMDDFLAFIADFFGHLAVDYADTIQQWKCSIRHISELALKDYIEKDSENFSLNFQKLQEFWKFYASIFKVIKDVCPQIMIGSPEFDLADICSKKEVLDDFYTFCFANNCIPDFIIAHSSCSMPVSKVFLQQSYHIYLADSKYALSKAKEFTDNVKNIFGNRIPCYCSNFSVCEAGNPLNDTAFASAFLASYLHRGIQFFDMIGVRMYPAVRPSAEFSGAPSLLTKSDIPKACYHTYTMIHQTFDSICYLDDNICISSNGMDFSVLAVNCSTVKYRYLHQAPKNRNPLFNKNPKYYHAEKDELLWPDGQIHASDNNGDILHIHLFIKDLPSTDYSATIQRVSSTSGNPYDVWRKSGELNFSSKEDISYIRNTSLPSLYKKKLSGLPGFLYWDFTLHPNEVCCMSFHAVKIQNHPTN